MELVALSTAVCNPFDSWKHRAQGPYAKEISWWKIAEGTKLYKGVGYQLAHGMLTPGFLVLGYNIRREQDGSYVAGLKSRFATTLLLQPIEFIRSAKQAGNPDVAQTVANIGIGCLWRGLGATVARDLSFAAIYWASFQAEDPRMPFAGAFAATLVSHPFDVIKTKMQTFERQHSKDGYIFEKKERFFETARELWAKEGAKVFTAGLLPRMLKVVPCLGILGIGAYEMGWVVNGDGYSMIGPVKRDETESFVHPQPHTYAQIEIRPGWSP